MTIVAYARVSTTGQSLEVQLDQLRAAGAEEIWQEQKSGTSTHNRVGPIHVKIGCRVFYPMESLQRFKDLRRGWIRE